MFKVDETGGPSTIERFIYPTVRTAPTNNPSQQGVEVGIPEPHEENIHDEGVRLNVDGSLRRTSTTDPTVQVRVEAWARSIVPQLQPLVQQALDTNEVDVTNILQAIAAGLRHRQPADTSVPAVSIRRENYDKLTDGADGGFIGVTAAFNRWPEGDMSAIPPTGGGTTPWEIQGPLTLIEDADGRLLAVALLKSNDNHYDIGIWYYDQAGEEGEGWQGLFSLPTHDLADFLNEPSLNGKMLTALRRDEELFVLVACQTDIVGKLYVLQLVGTGLFRIMDGVDIPQPTMCMGAWWTEAGAIIALDTIKGLRMLRSTDLRHFSQSGAESVLAALAQFVTAKRIGPRRFTDVTFADSLHGWACTGDGNIFATADGGVTWQGQISPAAAAFNPAKRAFALSGICGIDNGLGDGSFSVFAAGADGLLLRSVDSGATWKVREYNSGDPQALFGRSGAVVETGNPYPGGMAPSWSAIRLTQAGANADTVGVWLCGTGGVVIRSLNGGLDWTTIWNAEAGNGVYSDLVVNSAGTQVMAVGNRFVHANPTTVGLLGDRNTRAVLLTGIGPDGTHDAPKFYLPQENAGGDGLVAIDANSIARTVDITNGSAFCYVVSGLGTVYRWQGDNTAGAWTDLGNHVPDASATDISVMTDEKVAIATDLGGAGGLVYVSVNANDQSAPAFTPYQTPTPALAIWYFDTYVGVVASTDRLMRSSVQPQNRQYPALLGLPDGSLLLAVANIPAGTVEIHRASHVEPGVLPTFNLIDHGLTFEAFTSGPELTYWPALRPTLTATEDGTVILTAGTNARIGLQFGTRWVDGTDPSIALPVGPLTGGDQFGVNTFRATLYYGHGRLFSIVPHSTSLNFATWVCWDWQASGPYFRPVIPGKPFWLGVDNALGIFAGAPTQRNRWIVRPRYNYRASYVLSGSPSGAVWRSKTDDVEVELEWDRQHTDTVAVIGNGAFWNVSAFALFGTTFRHVTFAISDPTNEAVETLYSQTSVVETGTATLVATTGPSNVFLDPTKSWIPSEWKPGIRRWFVCFPNLNLSFRIADNTSNGIVIDGWANIRAGEAYQIYGDRFCWLGDGGTGPGATGLRNSKYRFGRYVRARIPIQPTPDGWFEIGEVVLGQEPVAPSDQHGFADGIQWQPVPNTTQDVSPAGPKAVTHYGRPGQLWTMEYTAETDISRGTRLNPLLERLRDPFVAVFKGTDINSVEYVRLVDGQKYQHVLGERFSSQWVLEEVV